MEASRALHSKGAPREAAPGSTATPQQANIIEQLVNATGASARALEHAAARVAQNVGGGADKETEALKTRLREAIREKHDVAVRAREATERWRCWSCALRAAGVAVP